MKKVIFLAMFMPSVANSQIVENFESGNLINWVQSDEGHWKSDTSGSISGAFSLHHFYDNPEAGADRIGMPLNSLQPSEGSTKWSFLVKHGYDPSASNNWSVFLMSDSEPSLLLTEQGANGYAIGVNLTGTDDTLRLWKVKGNKLTSVVTCLINWQTDIGISEPAEILVERKKEGAWTVSVSRLDGIPLVLNSGFDNELFNPAWFSILYRYSSTRDRLLWIDDIEIEGIFVEDTEAPIIIICKATGRNSVEVIFNEETLPELMVPENFAVNSQEIKSKSVIRTSSKTYRIEFDHSLSNKTMNSLFVTKICDKSGNCNQDIVFHFTPVWADQGDVIISEIMADPLPEVALPGKEYIELTNRTHFPVILKNWKLISESQSYLIPDITFPAEGIVLVCPEQDSSLFAKYGKVYGIKQFPSLTDGGKLLCLTDSSGILIHGVEYSSEWYGDELKSDGGWSLEMIDTDFPFFFRNNWMASSSLTGGTPATPNSVRNSNPDVVFSGLQNVFPDDSINMTVRFSEPLLSLTADVSSVRVGGKNISGLIPVDRLFRDFRIILAEPLEAGIVYQLEISDDILDFAGNSIEENSYSFGLTETPEPADILFNELLFNPLPGDPDYIELFNCSQKVIDASRLQVVSLNDTERSTSPLSQVSGEKRCFMPGTYLAITTDREKICDRYFSTVTGSLFESGPLPSMSDDEGHLKLYSRELELIDEVKYRKEMHYALLSDYEGVSLEKTAPGNKSMDAVNWHSASQISGWGTPGAPNSVYSELPVTSDEVFLSSSKITPDNDGYEDLLFIRFNITGTGSVLSVYIFDESGNLVRKIASNILAGPEASLIWDGTAEDGSMVRTGIYIVFITLYDDKGKTSRWKKVCTVIQN